ncbi:MAG: hypothetical protein ACREC0_01455 [Methylocella sp.]
MTDSAKEFRSTAFQRGCAAYGVSLRRRNRGRVHEGGVVERLPGKLKGATGRNDGATRRSIRDRDGYPDLQRRKPAAPRAYGQTLHWAYRGMVGEINVPRVLFAIGKGLLR